MKQAFVKWPFLLLTLILVSGCRFDDNPEIEPIPPSLHPEEKGFILTKMEGDQEIKVLRELTPLNTIGETRDTAQKLIITFWARWCPPCLTQITILDSIYLDLREKNWHISSFLFSPSFATDSTEISHEGTPRFPVGFASGEVNSIVGGVYSLPTTFVVESKQGVFYRIVGLIQAEQLNELLVDSLQFERGDTLYSRLDAP